jgi:hypothetical protein
MTDPHNMLLQWFYTNAPAAWLSAVIATLTCIYVLITRKRPQRLAVRHEASSPLVRVWPSIRKKITVAYDNRPVDSLGQIDVTVLNEGSEIIENPSIIISLPKGSKVLSVLIDPSNFGTSRTTDESQVEVSWPYSNPFREHKQIVRISLLVEGDTTPVAISGHGHGWSIRHVPLPTVRQITYRVAAFFAFSVGGLITGYFYAYLLETRFAVPSSEVSLRALLVSLPFVVPFLIGLLVLAARIVKPLKGYLQPRDLNATADEP